MHFSSEMVFKGTKRYPQSHGSTIVEVSDGSLLAAWYAGSREKGDDVVILTSRWDIGDGSWSSPKIAADTPGKPEGNPVLFQPSPETTMLFYQTIHGGGEGRTTLTTGWTTCDIKVKKSLDGGETWGPDIPVREEWGYVIRTKPILADGRILLPAHDERKWASLVLIGNLDGSAWTESGLTDTGEGFQRGNIEPALVELEDGRIMMYMRSGTRTCIWSSVSRDRGSTWSHPERTPLPNPDSALDLLRLEGGRTLLAYNNSSQGRSPLTLAFSEDECRSWTPARDLETGPGGFSYPAMVQDRDGRIHVTYTYKRQGIKHAAFDEEWALSECEGNS